MRSSVPSGAELRSWISRHLDPLDDLPPASPQAVPEEQLGLERFWNPDEAFRNAAVLLPLVEREEGLSVILTRRSDRLRAHTGQVALPGGRRDPGETPAQTALREAEEEIGLERRFVTLAGLSTPFSTYTGYYILPVVGFVSPGFTLTPNPEEVAEVFEVPFGFLMDPANYEEHERFDPNGGRHHYYATTHENQYVWGVTAGILRSLHDRIYGAALA